MPISLERGIIMGINETKEKFKSYFEEAHKASVLDEKTKELIHIAVVLALHCEPWVVYHFAVAKKMGITDEEIQEATDVAASVGAGTIDAMAIRAKRASDEKHYWWRKPK